MNSMLQQLIMHIRWKAWVAALLLVGLALGGCRQVALYEMLQNIPGAAWPATEVRKFQFEITDTTQSYWVELVLRHTNSYPYRNIWVKVGLELPGDSAKQSQFDLALAGSDKWLGTGMGDIFERRVRLFAKPVSFSKAGHASFYLQHTMRQDPLPGIMQVGLRLQPSTQ
jgi:gliding motility-associated lipoprotein GldH